MPLLCLLSVEAAYLQLFQSKGELMSWHQMSHLAAKVMVVNRAICLMRDIAIAHTVLLPCNDT